jgi:hypothetical protein
MAAQTEYQKLRHLLTKVSPNLLAKIPEILLSLQPEKGSPDIERFRKHFVLLNELYPNDSLAWHEKLYQNNDPEIKKIGFDGLRAAGERDPKSVSHISGVFFGELAKDLNNDKNYTILKNQDLKTLKGAFEVTFVDLIAYLKPKTEYDPHFITNRNRALNILTQFDYDKRLLLEMVIQNIFDHILKPENTDPYLKARALSFISKQEPMLTGELRDQVDFYLFKNKSNLALRDTLKNAHEKEGLPIQKDSEVAKTFGVNCTGWLGKFFKK